MYITATEQAIMLIKAGKIENDSKVLGDLISEHRAKEGGKQHEMWQKFAGEKKTEIDSTRVPVLSDFRSEIAEFKQGYLFGKPVKYSLLAEYYDDNNAYEKARRQLNAFVKLNNLEKLDAETGLYMSAVGVAYRLLYLDRGGDVKVMNIPPYECFIVKNAVYNEKELGVIYYDVLVDNKVQRQVEVYTSDKCLTYLEKGGKYILIEEMPHLFGGVPIIEYPNNIFCKSDIERVETYVVAYDEVMSDVQTEIRDFQQSYMVIKNSEVSADTIMRLKQLKVLQLEGQGDISYLVKNYSGLTELLESHKRTLRENIYQFAKAIDFQDKDFAGQSGEARKYKLMSVENDAINKERSFVSGTREMFALISPVWEASGVKLLPEALDLTVSRNLPADLLFEADLQSKLVGVVSTETRLKLFSAVTDVKDEMEKMREEGLLGDALDVLPALPELKEQAEDENEQRDS